MGRAEGGRADDNPIDTVLTHGLDDLPLALGVILRGGYKEAVAGALGDIFDPLEDLAKEGVIDAADDHTKRPGLMRLQAASGGAGMVTHFEGDLADAGGGLIRDQRVASQGA